MRTPRTTLIQTLKSGLPSVSSSLLAGLLAAGLSLTLPAAQATETEINSLSEERQIMSGDWPRPDSEPAESPAVTKSSAIEPKSDTESEPAAPAKPEAQATQDSLPAESKDTDSKHSASQPAESRAVQTQPAADAGATPVKPAPPTKSAKTAIAGEAVPAQPEGDAELPKAKSVDLAKPITREELQAPPVKEPASATKDTSTATQPIPSASEPAAKPNAPEVKLPTPDASKPAAKPKVEPAPPQDAAPAADAPQESAPEAETPPAETPAVAAPEPAQPKSLFILGTEVPAATSARLAWSPSQSFEGLSMPTPVLVVNGAKDGPTVCLTAAIHGDELNGIEVVRRVLYGLNPKELTGAVIGVPIVNLQGFRRSSRYLTDRRDLNRYFPGNPEGSSGARIAHSFFNSVIRHCNVLVDLHTGSFDRINLPQVRADLRDPESARLTHYFGATVVLHGTGAEGTLRRAAVEYGIPAVTLEAGGPMRLEEANVSHGVAAIRTLLNSMGMIKKFSFWGKPEPVYYQSTWVRVNHGGILFSNVDLGQKVKAGDVLGTVTDPITNVRHPILSTHDGRVIGMALNQVMLPGYAAYHIGIAAKDEVNAVPTDESLLLHDVDLSLSDDDLSELTARVTAE